MEKVNDKANLISALVKAQMEIRPPSKEGVNPMFKNKYATLDAIYSAIREPLATNGLSLSHSVEVDEQNRYFLVTTLMHSSGEFMQNKFPMVVEKLTNQGIASARTYACRYATCNMFALPSDEDDDGNAAEGRKGKVVEEKLSADQCSQIEAYTSQDKELEKRILNGYKVRSLSDIAVTNFAPIMKTLQKRMSA
jgi:hypothetical protein